MLSDNSQKQNAKNLANFNSSKSSKKKFMFVIDMLNEGVHIEQIDGIIWFRPLNEDSKYYFYNNLEGVSVLFVKIIRKEFLLL